MSVQLNSPSFRKEVQKLKGLPLLPCGAGDSYKAPLVQAWQDKSFTPEEVLKFDGLRCIGMRCGPDAGGLVAIDFDGPSAIEKAESYGVNFGTTTETWNIIRDSDHHRFKVVYRVPQTSWEGLPGKKIIKTGDGEQIEFFWSSGQIIVLGEHVLSGDEYHWGRGGPEWIDEIPLSVWAMWQDAIGTKQTTKSNPQPKGAWRDEIPCRICKRPTTDCQISSDGQAILCHYGKRWSPPVLAKGETIEIDGVRWAYCGDKTNAIGEAALFRIHEEQAQPNLRKQHKVTAGEALRLMLEACGDAPMLNVRTRGIHCHGREYKGADIDNLYLHLSRGANLWSDKLARDAFLELGYQQEFDPVAVYLNNLHAEPLPDSGWKKLGQFLLDVDDPVADKFLARYLVAAVARVISPGCQVRQCPVLLGDQNQGKTELGRALFGHDYYGDGLSSSLDVDDVTLMARCWGVELGELNGITRRTQAEKLKAFLSRRVDLVRRKYASTTEPVPRRSVFWATTNKSPLSDSSGSTRFVMIPLGAIRLPIDRVWQHRDSIWKRAYQEYRNHTQWYSTEEEMTEIISRNGDYDLVDPWSEPIGRYLRSHSGAAYIQHSDIYLHLGIDPERQHGGNARRITELMEAHGWKHGRKRIAGTKVRAFFPDQVDRATH